MHFKVSHKQNRIAAITKLKLALNQVRPKAADQLTIDEERWDGSTLIFAVTVQGKKITGKVEVTETEFIIDAKLPLIWRIFEGRIEKMIAEQVQQLRM